MGAFGGETSKGSNLYSDATYVHKLVRCPTAADRARFAALDREMMIKDPISGALTGGKDLTSSQAYPVECGREVAAAYKSHIESLPDEVAVSEASFEEEAMADLDSWADAGLGEVCEWLGLPAHRFWDPQLTRFRGIFRVA